MAKRVRKAAKRAPPRRTRAIPATKLSKLKASKPKTSKLKSRTPKPSKPKSGNSRSRMARLQSELRAAQDRQAASAEILRVIHQSPTDVQPVFEAIVQAAVRLLSCDFAHFLRCHNASFSLVAVAGPQGLLQAIEVGRAHSDRPGRQLPVARHRRSERPVFAGLVGDRPARLRAAHARNPRHQLVAVPSAAA